MNYKLLPWATKYLDDLVKHADNINVAKYLTDQFPHPYTREAGENFIKMSISDDPVQIMAIVIEGQAVGGIGLHAQKDIYRKNMELGYWLSEDFWGKGIMTKAVLEMIKYGFKNFDITRIYASPYGTNIGSQKVLEKAGFNLEVRISQNLIKNGQMEDELIYSVRREEYLPQKN